MQSVWVAPDEIFCWEHMLKPLALHSQYTSVALLFYLGGNNQSAVTRDERVTKMTGCTTWALAPLSFK
jgi:hypothetical protein